MSEEKEDKKGEDGTDDKPKEGVQSETDKKIEQLNTSTERINEAIAENKNAKARENLGGGSEGGTEPSKPKVLSDVEYAEAFDKGEVDPFKADGYV